MEIIKVTANEDGVEVRVTGPAQDIMCAIAATIETAADGFVKEGVVEESFETCLASMMSELVFMVGKSLSNKKAEENSELN